MYVTLIEADQVGVGCIARESVASRFIGVEPPLAVAVCGVACESVVIAPVVVAETGPAVTTQVVVVVGRVLREGVEVGAASNVEAGVPIALGGVAREGIG